jgi:hypothetical protein
MKAVSARFIRILLLLGAASSGLFSLAVLCAFDDVSPAIRVDNHF